MKSFKSFLDFEIMMTPIIMKVFYIVGSILIILGSLAAPMRNDLGLVAGAIGLVFFRVLCEQLILFYKIHNALVNIKDNTNKKIKKEE